MTILIVYLEVNYLKIIRSCCWMERNSYQDIKSFIYNKLQEVEGVLPQDKIRSEIKNTKSLLAN